MIHTFYSQFTKLELNEYLIFVFFFIKQDSTHSKRTRSSKRANNEYSNREHSLQHHHYYLHHHHHYYQLQQQQQYLQQQQQLKQQSSSSSKLLKSKSKNKIKSCTSSSHRPTLIPASLNLKLKNNSYDDSSSCCNNTTCSDTTTSSADNSFIPLNNAANAGVLKASNSVESSSSSHKNYNGLKPKSKPSKKTTRVSSLNQQTDSASTRMMEELETNMNESLNEYEQACRLINFDSNIDMIVSLIDLNHYSPSLESEPAQIETQSAYESLYNVSSVSDYENNSCGKRTMSVAAKSGHNAVLTLNSLNSFIQTINIPKYVSALFVFFSLFFFLSY